MISKTTVLETMQQLPEEFSIDELIERLIVVQKIEEGRQQIKNGNIISEKDVDERMRKWVVKS